MQTFNETPFEYFTAVLSFLKEEQWIYNYPNTHILVNKVLDRFKPDWINHLQAITNAELNGLPFGVINSNWPKSLQSLLRKIKDVQHSIEIYESDSELPVLQRRIRLSKKKAHEIEALTVVIHDLCTRSNISVVVDIGAGIGYLSYLLHEKYDYKILAVEGNPETFNLALKHQKNFYPFTKNSVKFVNHFITDNSADTIENFLKEQNWNMKGVCIAGLHACADLSVTILEILEKMEFVRALAVMPCCYHRLELSNFTCVEEKFKCFPVSDVFRNVYNVMEGELFLKRPFLRLACQHTGKNWSHMSAKEHDMHSKTCIFRAILQEVAYEDNLDVKRLKRKTGKFKGKLNCTIEEFCSNVKSTHILVDDNGVEAEIDTDFQSKLLEKWSEYKNKYYLVEIFTALQTAIQSICENIVLLDRVQFLREKGIKCDIYKVTDDRISPRCHALVANK